MISGRRWCTALAAAMAVGGAVTVVPSLAHADPVASAQTRAAVLTRQVARLNDQAEAASQRYDAIESRLGAAVTSSLSADRRSEDAAASVARAQQQIDARVQALYASAGSFGLLSSMLTGSDTQAAMERQQVSATVLSASAVAVSRDQMVATSSAEQAANQQLSAQQVTRLQRAAARQSEQVNQLLTTARRALAQADGTVRRLVAQQQQAALAAQSASFTAAVQADGGRLNPSTQAPNAIAAAAIAAARSRLGVPYVWGATGPGSFDCSGLTQWSYAHAGVALPRTAAEQWYSGPHPSMSQLQPGDLLFWAFDPNDPATIHHVAIYIGNGQMIAAPHTGENVQIQPVYLDGFFGATRPTAGH